MNMSESFHAFFGSDIFRKYIFSGEVLHIFCNAKLFLTPLGHCLGATADLTGAKRRNGGMFHNKY